jgi:DNA-binding NtrC family response regulator
MEHSHGVDAESRSHPAGILVSDEDRQRAQQIRSVVRECGVHPIDSPVPAFDDARDRPSAALVFLSGEAPDATSLGLIQRLAREHVPVLAYGENADCWSLGARCRALLAGACAVLDSSAPGFAGELGAKVAHVLAIEAEHRRQKEHVRTTFERLGIVGVSQAMIGIFHQTLRISALSDLHTLITGETGTGKQLLAEAIHGLDAKRRDGPFVALNCGAISAGLAESELFGHRRGAFTGADRDRRGLIRAAEGGVLFLDEVGELDLALQTKLLRVLQEGRVLTVGDDREVPVSVRVVAATNRPLEDMVRERTFRADLFHRLNVLSIHIPPLRERLDDIEALVWHFLQKNAALGSRRAALVSPEFVAALAEHELPGNARQVENLVRRAIVHKDDEGPLALADLPPEIWARVSERSAADQAAPPGGLSDAATPDAAYLSRVLVMNDWNLSRALASCERSLVETALRAASGNQSQTARLLGITPRSVYNKIRKHRLAASEP